MAANKEQLRVVTFWAYKQPKVSSGLGMVLQHGIKPHNGHSNTCCTQSCDYL